ncbi:MAG: DNA helicase, partial [Deltaproteobacteria bacterium]
MCVIGDPDQSIYGFRGSDVIYFKNFTTDYPDAEVINLTRNYRSTETILAASYQVIKNHQIKTGQARTYSDITGTRTVTVLESVSEKAEAVTVGKNIEKMIGGIGFHSMDFGNIDNNIKNGEYGFSDFAVLFRTASQGEVFKEVLESAGIPCQIASRENMFTKNGVAEIISFLKIMESVGSFIDFERIVNFLKPGIGNNTLNVFKNWCYRNRFNLAAGMHHALLLPIDGLSTVRQLKLTDFIKKILKITTAAEKLDVEKKLDFIIDSAGIRAIVDSDRKIEDTVRMIKANSMEYGGNAVSFLCDTALQTDSDIYDEKAEKVSLMTMHAAKGLEFPVVFIAGCENGFIPFEKNGEPNDIEEERRLFYVAMTRAMQ